MIDAHTHITSKEFWNKRRDAIRDFVEIGGRGLVTVGMNDDANGKGIILCQESDYSDIPCVVKTTVGYEPSEVIFADLKTNDWINKIHDLSATIEEYEEHIVAVGECGVDLHYDNSRDVLGEQQEVFALQCQLALQWGLPLVVHSRDAFEETCIVLEDFTDLKIYFHCRGYGADEVAKVMEWFPQCYIGICGNVTYPKAYDLRESLSVIPHDRLLIETDAPYLTPQVLRGKQNCPAYITYTYDAVAEYLSEGKDILIDQVRNNFFDFYQL